MNYDDDELLRRITELASHQPETDGYVPLQTIPYRGHHLLARAVLDVTPDGGTVFEGGVSSGYFAEILTSYGITVDGFELDPVAAEHAASVCRTVHAGDLSRFDIDSEIADASYDTVLFGDTLEHLTDPVDVLRRLRPKLRDGGALVISVPNIANWAIRAQLLVGRFDYRDRGILDRTHLRFFTFRTVQDLFEDSGFEVVDIVGSVPVPGVSGRSAARFTHRAGNLRPHLMAYTFIVTGTVHRSPRDRI